MRERQRGAVLGADLATLVMKKRWSRRAEFPASSCIDDRLFSCGNGIYLRTNPYFGEGDPVLAIGWAESDYWAIVAWGHPPLPAEDDPPLPSWRPPPSLEFLGRPDALNFDRIRLFEASQPSARTVNLVTGAYRLTDGSFRYCSINGSNGITYIYGTPNPRKDEEPVAVELWLPEK